MISLTREPIKPDYDKISELCSEGLICMYEKKIPCPVDDCNGHLIAIALDTKSQHVLDNGENAELVQRRYVVCNGVLPDGFPCGAAGVWESHVVVKKNPDRELKMKTNFSEKIEQGLLPI